MTSIATIISDFEDKWPYICLDSSTPEEDNQLNLISFESWSNYL